MTSCIEKLAQVSSPLDAVKVSERMMSAHAAIQDKGGEELCGDQSQQQPCSHVGKVPTKRLLWRERNRQIPVAYIGH